ncbi:hypothetical protein Trydic_g21333 [Trypoxylus dichotomus]
MGLITAILIAGVFFADLGVDSASVDPRIFYGYKASIYDFPYQLSLHYKGEFNCGGEIIGEHYALTAAHCVYNYKEDSFEFRSGSSFRSNGGIVHKINLHDIYIHEKYNEVSIDYDIALVYVRDPLLSKNSIARAVTLPNSSYVPPPGVNAIVTGWGRCNNCPIDRPLQLNAVELPLIPWTRCQASYVNLTERMLCAGYDHGHKGAAKGDSGGPLVIDGILIGVVSFGLFSFPIVQYPSVFANIVVLSEWIKEKITELEHERM